MPLLAAAPSGPIAGELWLTVLDVGQGLSVVARTARHTLVYDTGPSYGPRFEAGGAVVAPYLRHIGRSTVDTLVLSHGDSDHVGGLAGLRRAISIKAVLANDEAGASACRTGVQWRWDGVDFRVLHPEAGQGWRGNDGSCVLAIRAGAEQVLLTGDAGRRAERAIVARHGPTLRSRVLVVAHHGSATSTSPALLRATAPDVSVVSAGYRNRYGMPAPAVLARLDAAGTRVLRTDLQGAVSVRLGREEGRVPVETERAARPRYWDGSR